MSKHGDEIKAIIERYADKCRSIGLPVPDIKTFQHVLSGHMEGGLRILQSSGAARSLFKTGEDWFALAREVWEKGSLTEVGVKMYDFGRTIGFTPTGEPTSVARVVAGGQRLVTAYPIPRVK